MFRKNENNYLQLAKLLFLLVFITILSCRKPVSYPNEPEITYDSGEFQYTKDLLGNQLLQFNISLDFNDGDGNVGWAASAENPYSFRPCDVIFTHDLYINLYEKINGNFVKRNFATDYYCDQDTLKNNGVNSLNANIPYMVGQGQSEVLVGNIEYQMTLPTLLSDTVKFDFQLSDRDNNLSNIIETPELIVPAL